MLKKQRRDFLTRSLAGLLAGSGGASVLNSLSVTNALAQQGGEYRALVCLFLYGGNDSFNMFVPRSAGQYSAYREARRNLAVDSGQLLGVDPVGSDGSQYGFHPAMPEVRDLFTNGRVAVLGNVGPLVVPTSRDDFIQERVPLPPRLFSHNDQQAFWQSLNPDAPFPSGWAGRMADAMLSSNVNRQMSMNVSMSGINLMQTGRTSIPYILSTRGVDATKSQTQKTGFGRLERRNAAMQALLNANAGHLFGNEYRSVMSRALDLNSDIRSVLASTSVPPVGFPGSQLGQSLAMVTRMISIREQLGLSRQIFFVGFGGWDTHSAQNSRHPALLSTLSQAMGAFYRATEYMGLSHQITSFTAADFGRTLTSNGDGSDHGWGGHQLVMGGAVNGNRIYGQMPEYRIEGGADSGRGRIIPTTAVDQFGATLARWYGLSESDLSDVFPNLDAFGSSNLGFLAS